MAKKLSFTYKKVGGLLMSEENKNRNKDKGRQNNRTRHNKQAADVEFANENENNSDFLNLDNKQNKRNRDQNK
ncbi:hypothetical protein [Virgibacillus necropolis]|uniref:hypothetical protein n=1 Tax=Virgibacillus necropolis TaxID=163877 RepID=UPI0012698F60|nr:hypothetical protein [Virgibacillus necropolis]